jgi:hypothetical protein
MPRWSFMPEGDRAPEVCNIVFYRKLDNIVQFIESGIIWTWQTDWVPQNFYGLVTDLKRM